MPIYMQTGPVDRFGNIDAKNAIKGTSQDKGHVGWIPVLSYSIGISHFIAAPRQITKGTILADIRAIDFARQIDGNSTTFHKTSRSTSPPMMAILDFTNKDGLVVEQLKVTGVQVLASTYSVDTSRRKPTESVTLSFSQVTVLKRLSTASHT